MKSYSLLANLPSTPKKDNQQLKNSQFENLIQDFLNKLGELPGFEKLVLKSENEILAEKIKATVLTEKETVHIKMNIVKDNLNHGKYDDLILSDNPEITEELEIVKKFFSRHLVQLLFVKCKSDEILRFWFDEQKISLPKDILALAVNLGANITVFKYLNENGYFENLTNQEKNALLKRASRFSGAGLDYLQEIFSNKIEINIK